MNNRQLIKLGVSESCCSSAIKGITEAAKKGVLKDLNVKSLIKSILENPGKFEYHEFFGEFAKAIIEECKEPVVREPAPYKVWGAEGIEQGAFDQMNLACLVPSAVKGAMMADSHLGYGICIGGVLATEDTVIPYCVGMDIACRMKISVFDYPLESLLDNKNFDYFRLAIEQNTRFGVGSSYEKNNLQCHDVMDDERWQATDLLKQIKDKAHAQLGSSGSGNHFVEFGILTITEKNNIINLPNGQYIALLSHGGSRGSGSNVCQHYSCIATDNLSKKMKEKFGRLAWLDMDSEAGQEYWLSMNLMGDYAAANHKIIHKNISKYLGSEILSSVENHHNFAWKEDHDGKEVIVHRKGATPAAIGDRGIIPGSMGSPAYVVGGKGNADSLNSASHGAGRVLSRKKAKAKYNFKEISEDLAAQGIRVISAGSDEVPGVYKDIDVVMEYQKDLVTKVARFDPKIVKMSGD